MSDTEFESLVQSALDRSARERATADDVALESPPGDVLVTHVGDVTEIRAEPGAMHFSEWMTAGLAGVLMLVAAIGSVVTALYFRDEFLVIIVVMTGWAAAAAAIHQFIHVRSPVVLRITPENLTVARRGLFGWRIDDHLRSSMDTIHVAISRLATSDESTSFDLLLTMRLTRPGRVRGTTETYLHRAPLIECRCRSQVDWIAATLRRTFAVPAATKTTPSAINRPRWPKKILDRLREEPLKPSPPRTTTTEEIGECAVCGYDVRGLGERRACPECGEPFRLNAHGDRVS